MSTFDILIVDDNPNNLFTLHTLLGRLGECRVFEADSGEAALAATVEHTVHLILLDVQMPGMDGFETARMLKMTGRTRDIPIVFVTAVFKADEFVQQGYELGAVDYLTKPIDDNLLLNRVHLYRRLWEREQRLRETLEELRHKEAMLIHQSRMAAIGEMIGAIAHQWRQPLNTLSIALQELQDAHEFGELDRTHLDETVAEGMKQIDHMSRTIDDFRNFFKPDKAKEPFNPREVVEEALKLVMAQLDWHRIESELACDCVGGEARLCGHRYVGYPGELKQVLLNIIGNAKDAIIQREDREAGFPGRIRIGLALSGEQDGACRITVEDNGGGIPTEHLNRIFEPYFTTKEEGKGTGIGLYMAKVIVEEHMHGRITAENTDDGARFTVQFGAG
ncbi:sensor histidine kinase [Endothiovibrio diazotrophicus]